MTEDKTAIVQWDNRVPIAMMATSVIIAVLSVGTLAVQSSRIERRMQERLALLTPLATSGPAIAQIDALVHSIDTVRIDLQTAKSERIHLESVLVSTSNTRDSLLASISDKLDDKRIQISTTVQIRPDTLVDSTPKQEVAP